MDNIELEGERVKLLPLGAEHVQPLFDCSRSKELWEHLPVKVSTVQEMQHFVTQALQGRESGDEFPFAVFDKQLNRIVGTTRFLRIASFHRNLNIGWTWYSPEVWRTLVNTECKYLLLKYAFEEWEAVRVELITTTTHHRSQRAIERLGAQREGILRKKYNGLDYVIFSIISEEWQQVKERLDKLMNRGI
ncbi:Protein N-acetyltransferase, RimJ/RimL family [Paenibacillus catalpae]|uniref:Protein N-acetyltransferase, RimJ/RimL family n=1 Tax=Paenibacillus catalpae TaxID=1045775 RepID=A0A1I2D8R4_9BACL|nr:GNAT family protein [Paenibacillus catalpae]SFE76926.1 Protein N-acetyltransferase, RimJ/RimL family [Paenibacillus catalpae]